MGDNERVILQNTMKTLSVDHLLGIKSSQRRYRAIFQTADNFKEVINRPIKKYFKKILLSLTYFLKIQLGQDYLLSLQKRDFLQILSIFLLHLPL